MIYDLADNLLSSFSFSVDSGETATLQLKVDCLDGYEFYCDTVPGITVEGRKQGEVSWTSIETTPIDLSAWAGTRQIFEVRLSAAAVTAIARKVFSLRVEKA